MYPLTLAQAMIEVGSVVQIIETDAVLDEDSGNWVRDIQIYREPDPGSTNPVLMFTLRLKGATKSDIYFHAPAQDY
jgi:hypothetical protein